MVDKIKCCIENANTDLFSDNIKHTSSYTNMESGKYFSNYKYLGEELKINQSGNLYFTFSLHKFFYGNNHSFFNYEALQEATCILERDFGVDRSKIKVKAIEFSINFECEKPAHTYLSELFRFEDTEDFIAGNVSNTKYFTNRYYTVMLYDKKKHSKLKWNLFRYEIKLQTLDAVKKFTGKESPTLEDFVNREAYGRMLAFIHDTYLLLPKQHKEVLIDFSSYSKLKPVDIKDALAQYGLSLYGGYSKLSQYLRTMKHKFAQNRFGRIKQLIKSEAVKYVPNSELEEEFESHFFAALEVYAIKDSPFKSLELAYKKQLKLVRVKK